MFSPQFISNNTLDDILKQMDVKDIYNSYEKNDNPQLIKAVEDKFKNIKNHKDFQQNIINILDSLNPQNDNDKEILETLHHFFMALQSGDSVPLTMGSSCPFGDDCRFIQRYPPNSHPAPTQSIDEKHLEKYHKNHWTLPINEKIYKLLRRKHSCKYGDRCRRTNPSHKRKYHPYLIQGGKSHKKKTRKRKNKTRKRKPKTKH